jgi:hypothetical protein
MLIYIAVCLNSHQLASFPINVAVEELLAEGYYIFTDNRA